LIGWGSAKAKVVPSLLVESHKLARKALQYDRRDPIRTGGDPLLAVQNYFLNLIVRQGCVTRTKVDTPGIQKFLPSRLVAAGRALSSHRVSDDDVGPLADIVSVPLATLVPQDIERLPFAGGRMFFSERRRFSDDAVARLRVSCSFGGAGGASRASRSMRSCATRCTKSMLVSVTRTDVGSAEESDNVTESARRGKIEHQRSTRTQSTP